VSRSRIVLACAEGRASAQVPLDLGVSRETVRKWRGRLLADRLEGLVDRPRSGAPRKITDEQVEALVARTLDQVPPTGIHTGRRVPWLRRRACRSRLSRGSGGRSASSRTSWRPGSCRPLDELIAELNTNTNAIHKSMFDARKNLCTSLVADGYIVAVSKVC
jgi:transposase-like protein